MVLQFGSGSCGHASLLSGLPSPSESGSGHIGSGGDMGPPHAHASPPTWAATDAGARLSVGVKQNATAKPSPNNAVPLRRDRGVFSIASLPTRTHWRNCPPVGRGCQPRQHRRKSRPRPRATPPRRHARRSATALAIGATVLGWVIAGLGCRRAENRGISRKELPGAEGCHTRQALEHAASKTPHVAYRRDRQERRREEFVVRRLRRPLAQRILGSIARHFELLVEDKSGGIAG